MFPSSERIWIVKRSAQTYDLDIDMKIRTVEQGNAHLLSSKNTKRLSVDSLAPSDNLLNHSSEDNFFVRRPGVRLVSGSHPVSNETASYLPVS